MKRRDILGGFFWLGSGTFALAQTQVKQFVVATLWTTTPEVADPYVKQFEAGLRERGWLLGETLLVEHRLTHAQPNRLAPLAAEVISLRPNAILAGLESSAITLKKLTANIPIIVGVSTDPVAAGLTNSISRPDGNVTGNMLPTDVAAKRIQLVREIFPHMRRIGVLHNATGPNVLKVLDAVFAAGKEFAVEIQPAPLSRPQDLQAVLRDIRESGCDAIFPLTDNFTSLLRKEIATFALQNRIATITGTVEMVRDGALFSYSPSLSATFRRAAYFVDRILRGARPSELPFEQPVHYELAVNLSTARAIGVTVPGHILAIADEVID